MEPVTPDRRRFTRFLGVDLGGGKGKKTAIASLRRTDTGVVVDALAPRNGDRPLYDTALVEWIAAAGPETLVAVDAPLRLPACLRCAVPKCPGLQGCVDPSVVLMRDLSAGAPDSRDVRRGKPAVTPYTQRATEIYLQRRRGVLPRETLGQGMGPLSARAAHLLRALADRFALNRNLIEVYPKATLALLGFELLARRYKRHMLEREVRAEILAALSPGLAFAPGVWREDCVQSDHTFDAVICAYTGYLWARDDWQVPHEAAHLLDDDGWIWVPPERTSDAAE